MPGEADRSAPELLGALDERVLSALEGLHGSIAFSGLRRVLRAHPESLSRSLRRLEREGRIERSDGGYRALTGTPNPSARASLGTRPIAQVDLPPGVSAELVFGRMTGRWFGSLRWVGLVDHPAGRLLAWAKRDGDGFVLLGVQKGVLRVYARDDPSQDDPEEAEDSAYELLAHAVDAIRPGARAAAAPTTFLSTGAEAVDLPFDN